MIKRKKKFVVWLHNHLNVEDDFWAIIYAKNEKEAHELVQYDKTRFYKGATYTARDFRKYIGFTAK